MHVPTVLNAVFNFRLTWNGKTKDFREQAITPIHNPVEMGMGEGEAEKRLNKNNEYKRLFKEVYKKERITLDDIVDAIAEFEKALITPDSKFDRYLRGEKTLSRNEVEGYVIFKKIGCATCHNGINMGGNSFQKIGVINPYPEKKNIEDLHKVTGRRSDINTFKVPTLKNIALNSPYFHDGSAKTLARAIRKMCYHNLGLMRLNEEDVRKIVAFLRTLTGRIPDILDKR
jgi:cytochrome c peroxidase